MTYEFGDKQKPVLVLLHGYLGSGLTYYPIFKDLQKDFHVYAIDLLGMGCSSRPDFLGKSIKSLTVP